MTIGAVLRLLGKILFGYLAAVVVAVAVAETIMFAPRVLGGGMSADDLLGAVAVGLVWTAMFALPGFVAVVAVAALLGWRHWVSFALAGALNAVPSLFLLGLAVGDPPGRLFGELLGQCMAGGLAGGLAYWALSGRNPLLATSPAPSGS